MFYFLFLTNFLKQRVCYEELKFSPDKALIRHWLTGENYEMTGNYRSPAVNCSTVVDRCQILHTGFAGQHKNFTYFS